MPLSSKSPAARLIGKPTAYLSRFRRDEGGSMIVFTIFILTLMLVVGGMAVDFMRFESRRTMMQGALDNAVLAAADLDQQLDPAAVVVDHMTKSEAGNCLSSAPKVTPGATYRKVEAECRMVLNTFFIGLVGMDTLEASAASIAIEGVGDVEVSLILDISGSMRETIPNTTESKIERLRTAGGAFVDTLLKPEYEDKVSLSLIAYSEDVNVGPDLYSTFNTQDVHGFSHCVELPESAFDTTVWDNSQTLPQVPHFQFNPSGGNPTIDQPVCPQQPFERIVPISQSATALKGAISQLQPRSGTAIFTGMKWGVTLLDPSFRDNISALPSSMIDPAFAGRPNDFTNDSGGGTNTDNVAKYIVLMTDGRNHYSYRPLDEFYDSPSEIAHWSTMNYQFFRQKRDNYNRNYVYAHNTPELGDTRLRAICQAAKDRGIIVFSIAMGADSHGEQEMRNCASSTGHYYATSGAELVAIFEAIAKQITDLRLTL